MAENLPLSQHLQHLRPKRRDRLSTQKFLIRDILSWQNQQQREKGRRDSATPHFAPLYEDVDAPVVSPFDIPEEEEKAAPASEIHIEETSSVEEPVFEAPAADAAEEIEEEA